ncbi:hypothetical protein WJX72_001244 [[Myrmecia] bisecta]|uniref:Neurochondrin n=1 Tax=[Myrmecia] bisecta TaxID=41462 RepID=A0AAW1PP68_9CHLO
MDSPHATEELANTDCELILRSLTTCDVSELSLSLSKLCTLDKQTREQSRIERLQALEVCWESHVCGREAEQQALELLLLQCIQADFADDLCSEDMEVQSTARLLSQVCRFIVALLQDQSATADALQVLEAAFQSSSQGLGCLHRSLQQVEQCSHDLCNRVSLAAADFLRTASTAFWSERWLSIAGVQTFATVSKTMQAAMKEAAVPLMGCLIMQALCHNQESESQAAALELEPLHELVKLGTTAGDLIAGRSPLSPVKEFRSFAVLNVAWTSVARLLLAVPEASRESINTKGAVTTVLNLLVTYLEADFKLLVSANQTNQLKVVLFWLQHIVKIAAGYPQAAVSFWPDLAATTSRMFDSLRVNMPAETGAEQRVLPRLVHILLETVNGCADQDVAAGLAMLALLTSCYKDREEGARDSWAGCEECLFLQAVQAHPVRLQLLLAVWAALCRHAEPALAEQHISILYMMLENTTALEAPDTPSFSPLPAQLTLLLGGLLPACPPDLAQSILCSMIEAGEAGARVDARGAALLAATLRVANLELVDDGPIPDCLPAVTSLAGVVVQLVLSGCAEAEPGPALPLYMAPSLHVLANLLSCCTAEQLASLMPAFQHLQRQPEVACAVATCCAGLTDMQPPPKQLFQSVMEATHWACQHEAMESLLAYVRCPSTGDFKALVPNTLIDPDSRGEELAEEPFVSLLKQYMQRVHTRQWSVLQG